MDGRFVVVSGLPGSGKTTLARRLGPALGLPVLDKDDLLEASFPAGPVPPALRSALSRRADEELTLRARASGGAVLVSFWRRVELSPTSGTPVDWLAGAVDLVEVHCTCPPAVALGRFTARHRHPGHGDAHRRAEQLLDQFTVLARCGPLGLGPVVPVDTEQAVDADEVAARVRAARA